MGWYKPEEHPFGGEYLDFYGDERENLDPKQEILSTDLKQMIIYLINMDMAI